MSKSSRSGYYTIHLSWYQLLFFVVGCSILSFREGSIVATIQRTYHNNEQQQQQQQQVGIDSNSTTLLHGGVDTTSNSTECCTPHNYDMRHDEHCLVPHDRINRSDGTTSSSSCSVYDYEQRLRYNNNRSMRRAKKLPTSLLFSSTKEEESMRLQSDTDNHHDHPYTASNEYYYEEAMVHPSLLVHPHPHRIVVLFDISGRIVQQVLKHDVLVQEVTWIVPAAAASMKVTPAQMKRSDPRINLIYTDDPVSYFQQSLTGTPTAEAAKIDVVFVDALTYPNVIDHSFLSVVDAILGDCGMMVCHVGQAETMRNLPASLLQGNVINDHNRWVVLVDAIRHNKGFQGIADYNEGNEKFIVGMKCKQCQSDWIGNEAEFQIAIAKRIQRNDIDLIFDGSTMMNYQFPSRIAEEVWCRNEQDYDHDDDFGDKISCTGHGYDPDVTNVPLSSLVVNTSVVANGGRGVFTTQAITKGSTIVLDACVQGMIVPITTLDLLYTAVTNDALGNVTDFWTVLADSFIDGYGWSNSYLGGAHIGGVDTSILTFFNHGCNGSYNVGMKADYHEMNMMDCDTQDKEPCRTCSDTSYAIYDPFLARQYPMWQCQQEVANRNIEVGEEMLFDYVCLAGTKYLMEVVTELQNVCSGGIGFVSRYEHEIFVSPSVQD